MHGRQWVQTQGLWVIIAILLAMIMVPVHAAELGLITKYGRTGGLVGDLNNLNDQINGRNICPAVNDNLNATPGCDMSDDPGYIEGNITDPDDDRYQGDLVVRTNDSFEIITGWNWLGVPAGSEEKITLSGRLPVGFSWAGVPRDCKTSESSINDQTIICVREDFDTNDAGAYAEDLPFLVRVDGGVQNGIQPGDINFTISGENAADSTDGVRDGTDENLIIVTAAPRWNIDKGRHSVTSRVLDDQGHSGWVVAYNYFLELDEVSGETDDAFAYLGNESLGTDVSINFIDDLSQVSPNAKLVTWEDPEDACSMDKYTRGSHPYPYYFDNNPKRSIATPKGTMSVTCSQTGQEISIQVQHIDASLNHYPSENKNGSTVPVTRATAAIGVIRVFIPEDDVQLGVDGINGTDDDGSLRTKNCLTGFDPVSISGLSNFAEQSESEKDNCYALTLDAAKGSWGKTFRRHWDQRGKWSAAPADAAYVHSGDGTITPGGSFATLQAYRNAGIKNLTGVELCDVFDANTYDVTDIDGTPGSAAQVKLRGGATFDYKVQYAAGYVGNWPPDPEVRPSDDAIDEVVQECTDPSVVWHDTTTEARLLGPITKMRLVVDPDGKGDSVEPGNYVYVTTRHTVRAEDLAGNPLADNMLLVNYATVKDNEHRRGIFRRNHYRPKTANEPHSSGHDGDRLSLVRAKARILNEVTPDFSVPGGKVSFILKPSFSADAQPAEQGNVKIIDLLPLGLDYQSGSSTAGYGEPTIYPANVANCTEYVADLVDKGYRCDSRETILVWDLGNRTAGEALEELHFDAIVSVDAPATALHNYVIIESPVDASQPSKRIDNANVTITVPSSLLIVKAVETPIHAVNGSAFLDWMKFKVHLRNGKGGALTDLDVIDVLPFNGDGIRGVPYTPQTTTIFHKRSPATDFKGAITFDRVAFNDRNGACTDLDLLSYYYTNSDPGTIDLSPVASSNDLVSGSTAWCAGTGEGPGSDCGFSQSQVTALRVKGATIQGGATCSVELTLATRDNKDGNIYSNNAGAKATGVSLPVMSNDVSALVFASSIGENESCAADADLVYVPLNEACRVINTGGFSSPFDKTIRASQSFLAWGSKAELDAQRDIDGSDQLNACLPVAGLTPSAMAANVTVKSKAFKSRGNLVAFANGTPPPVGSLINFFENNIANSTVISLSPRNAKHLDIEARLFGNEVGNLQKADVIVDALGYFYSRSEFAGLSERPDLTYVPLAANCRLVDTAGFSSSFEKDSRETQSFLAWGSKAELDAQRNRDGSKDLTACLPLPGLKPAAMVANVTVKGKAYRSRGNMVAYPNGSPVPASSLVNFFSNNIANSSIISLNSEGAEHFDIHARLFGNEAGNLQKADVIVDVEGYFYPQSEHAGVVGRPDMTYVPLGAACRIVSTNGSGSTFDSTALSTQSFRAWGSKSELDAQRDEDGSDELSACLPQEGLTPSALVANVTVASKAFGARGNIIAYPNGGEVPESSLVNFSSNNIGNSTVISLNSQSTDHFDIQTNFFGNELGNARKANVVVDALGYFYPAEEDDCLTLIRAKARILKSVTPTIASPGNDVTFTLKPSFTSSTSPPEQGNIKIIDLLPIGLNYKAGSSTASYGEPVIFAADSGNETNCITYARELIAQGYSCGSGETILIWDLGQVTAGEDLADLNFEASIDSDIGETILRNSVIINSPSDKGAASKRIDNASVTVSIPNARAMGLIVKYGRTGGVVGDLNKVGDQINGRSICPQINTNANATPGCDMSDQPGYVPGEPLNPADDSYEGDLIVRTNDAVEVFVGWNWLAVTRNSVERVRLVSTLPKGFSWTTLPTLCEPSESFIDGQTISCVREDFDTFDVGSYAEDLPFIIRVDGSVRNGTKPGDILFSMIAEGADTRTDGVRDGDDDNLLVVTASPRWNLQKDFLSIAAAQESENGDLGWVVNYKFYLELNEVDGEADSKVGFLGNESLGEEATVSFTDDLSGVSPNARLLTWDDEPGCTMDFKVDESDPYPYLFEDRPEQGVATPRDTSFVSCTPSGPGAPVSVQIHHVDATLNHYPSESKDSKAIPVNRAIAAIGLIRVFIPATDVELGEDGLLGTGDDNVLEVVNCLTDFDPVSISGISNFGHTEAESELDNCHSFTLNAFTRGGAWSKTFRKYWDQYSSDWFLPPTDAVAIASGDGTITPNETFATLQSYRNGGSTGQEGVVLCDVIDANTFDFTDIDGHPGSATQVRLDGGGVFDYQVQYATGYVGNWPPDPYAAPSAGDNDGVVEECADAHIVWYDTTTEARQHGAITKMRVVVDPDGSGDKVEPGNSLNVTTHHTARATDLNGNVLENGILLVNYANYKQGGEYVANNYVPRTTFEPHSGIFSGDRLTLVRAKARVTETVTPIATSVGHTVTFTLQPSLTSRLAQAEQKNVIIKQLLSDGLIYKDGTANLAYGEPTLYSANSENCAAHVQALVEQGFDCREGQTILVWDLGLRTINQPLPSLTFDALVSVNAPNSLQNYVLIESPADVSAAPKRTDNANIAVTVPTALLIGSRAVAPRHEINHGSLLNWLQFDVDIRNGMPAALTDLDVIDVLPFHGDGSAGVLFTAQSDIVINYIRTPATQFQGDLVFDQISFDDNGGGCTDMASLKYYYTAVDPKTIDLSPLVASNDLANGSSDWCLGTSFGPDSNCGYANSGVTAVRVKGATMQAGALCFIHMTLSTRDNLAGDTYTNNAGARATGVSLPVLANNASALVSAASIRGTVWLDANSDGIQDNDETGISGVVVNLLQANASTAVKDLANPANDYQVTTSINGNYQFDNLLTGDYVLQFELGDTEATVQGASDDETQGSDIDTAGNTAIITLRESEQRQDVDAGIVPFDNTRDVDDALVYVPFDEPCRIVNTGGFSATFDDAGRKTQSFLAWGSKEALDEQRDVDNVNQLGACLPLDGLKPSAMVANITVAAKAFKSRGNIVAYRNGRTPPASSLVNFFNNNIANSSVISLSPENDHHFNIQAKLFGQEKGNRRKANVIIDALGYFYRQVDVADLIERPDMTFVPLESPCRIVNTLGTDSSMNDSTRGVQSFLAWGSKEALDAQRDTDGSEALSACLPVEGLKPSALVANITAVAKAFKARGNMVAYRNGRTPPKSSLVNFLSNNIANSSVIPLNPDNEHHFDIYGRFFGNEANNRRQAHLIVDAIGYFYSHSALANAFNRPDMVYVPLDAPCRVVNTGGFASTFNKTTRKNQSFLAWGSRVDLDAQRDEDGSDQLSACLPEPGRTPAAMVANITVAAKAFKGRGNVVAYAHGRTPPDSSLVNFQENNVANASVISLSSDNLRHFNIEARFFGNQVGNQHKANVIVDAIGYFYPRE